MHQAVHLTQLGVLALNTTILFLAHNLSSSRTIPFVEDPVQQVPETPKPPVVNYKPRTTNASMDALKKLREESACKTTTINTLTTQLEEVQKEKAAMEWLQEETTREVMKEAPKEESKEEDNGYQMLRPARLPVRPIYVIVKEKYIDIDELAEFVVQDYCNGRAESMGQCADQTYMTPNREKKGRAFVTSTTLTYKKKHL